MTRPVSQATLRAVELVRSGETTQVEAAKQCGISRSALYRALQGDYCDACGARASGKFCAKCGAEIT